MTGIGLEDLNTRFRILEPDTLLEELVRGFGSLPVRERADYFVLVPLEGGGYAVVGSADIVAAYDEFGGEVLTLRLDEIQGLLVRSLEVEREAQGLGEARRVMRRSPKRRLVVLEDGQPVGLLVEVERGGQGAGALVDEGFWGTPPSELAVEPRMSAESTSFEEPETGDEMRSRASIDREDAGEVRRSMEVGSAAEEEFPDALFAEGDGGLEAPELGDLEMAEEGELPEWMADATAEGVEEVEEYFEAEAEAAPEEEEALTREVRRGEGRRPQAGLVRYPSLDAPEEVLVQERFSLTVELLLEAVEPAAEAMLIRDVGPPSELPEVELVLRARGFDVEGSNTKTLAVDRQDESSERFTLIAREAGEHTLRVDFYQHDKRIGTARRNIRVVVERAVAQPVEQPAEAASMELRAVALAPPPDLELTVELDRHDGKTLYFELHSTHEAIGYHRADMGSVTLQGSPLEKMKAVYEELSQMARVRDSVPAEERVLAERRLAAVGKELWNELIPERLKQEYWRFKPRVASILITADEPWVPWEMIKPYRHDESGELEEDPYWCQQFAISRWLAGPGAADQLALGTVRVVAPEQADLPAVKVEESFVEGLGELNPGVSAQPAFRSRLQLLNGLEQDVFSVLHFACHGLFDASVPDNSAISLGDGLLRPSDIHARFGGQRPRPLIFLNACHGARLEFGFTGLGGWADRLVKNARAGAFVGAQWEVQDRLALHFAQRFYTALFQENATVAEALRQAREEIRREAPYNSTWLAYALYADPESRVQA